MPLFISRSGKAGSKIPPRAFSLVEMIVAIGIFLILTSLLLSVLSSAKSSAQAAACLSKLKGLGAAAALYSADHDQKLIPQCLGTGAADAQTWRIVIQPYLGSKPDKSSFTCPADKVAAKSPNPGTQGLVPASYGINDPGNRIPSSTYEEGVRKRLFDYLNAYRNGKRTSDVVNPAGTIFLSDIGRPDNPGDPLTKWVENTRGPGAASYGYARFPNEASYSAGTDAWDIYPRHGTTKANVLFFDGHAAMVDIVKEIINHPPGDPECIYDNN